MTKRVELSVLGGGLILFGGNHSALSSSSPDAAKEKIKLWLQGGNKPTRIIGLQGKNQNFFCSIKKGE